MIAVDSSTLMAYLRGGAGPDVDVLDATARDGDFRHFAAHCGLRLA